MTDTEYITSRIDDQLSYYEKQSKRNKNTYTWISGLQLFFSVSIPIIAGFSDSIIFSELILALLGLFISLFIGLLAILKSHEKWMKYRTTCENLKHHKFKYLTKTNPYDTENNYSLLVENIEGIISKENSDWNNIVKPKEIEK